MVQVNGAPSHSRASRIVAQLKLAGIDLVVSLPDKWLSPLIEEVDSDPGLTHLRVAREDDGVGICAGAYLGGRRAALICQNAGLLVSTNVLAGIALHHQIPFLILAAYRGSHDDAYYYQVYKGEVTEPILQAIGLPYHVLRGPDEDDLIAGAAQQSLLARRPVVVLMTKRALLDEPPVGAG